MSVVRAPSPRAIQAAESLLDELAITGPEDMDVTLVAAHCGLFATTRSLANEEGHLVRTGRHGIASVDTRAVRSRKWRFVVAHELGHFLLHEGHDDFARCTTSRARPARRRVESEANDFASELLLPRRWFAARCAGRLSLDAVQALARTFRASLTSTALRALVFTDTPCALVHATGGVVDWWACSASFRGKVRRRARVEDAWPSDSVVRGETVSVGDSALLVWLTQSAP
jgi:hypothetical protein